MSHPCTRALKLWRGRVRSTRLLPWSALPLLVLALGGWTASGVLAHARIEAREGSPEQVSEYQLKAAYVYNFARYVRWPEDAFKGSKEPLIIAVFGRDPFGKLLDEAILGRKVGERPLAVERWTEFSKLGHCHVLFVPANEEKQLNRLRAVFKDSPVLIVGESISAAENGSQIGFFLEASKLRFAINTTAARSARLEISSELLKLARLIEDKPEPGR